MKKARVAFLVAVIAFVLAFTTTNTVAQAPGNTESPEAREARLAWFKQAKYGLFIHWGLYAIPAGEWKGKTSPGLGEWVMNRSKIPVKQYEQLANQFNPTKFDADAWVQMAQNAGMKYIVITSKHHDGFALFDSKVSNYNVVAATPFKRDILKELADACHKRGMPLGFYYSQSQDWHEPGGAGNDWDFGPDMGPDGKELKDYDGYLRGKAEPQVRELLSNYGPVALIWFDTPRMMTPERAQRFATILRTLQPKTLIDGRLGAAGDYRSTGDNVIPSGVQSQYWEVPATTNHTWGYRKDDEDWKSPGEITFKLVDIVSKGGNYLLNVGPMSDGVIPIPAQNNLRTVGRWLKMNGDAVYGAGPTPWGDELGEPTGRGTKDVRGQPLELSRNEWRVTTRPGKLYFTFFQEPRVPFPLPPMKNAVKRAYQLADGKPVEIKEENGQKQLIFPRPILDPMATVVVVEIEGDQVEK
jgi:alpha-L-fucosidase